LGLLFSKTGIIGFVVILKPSLFPKRCYNVIWLIGYKGLVLSEQEATKKSTKSNLRQLLEKRLLKGFIIMQLFCLVDYCI